MHKYYVPTYLHETLAGVVETIKQLKQEFGAKQVGVEYQGMVYATTQPIPTTQTVAMKIVPWH